MVDEIHALYASTFCTFGSSLLNLVHPNALLAKGDKKRALKALRPYAQYKSHHFSTYRSGKWAAKRK